MKHIESVPLSKHCKVFIVCEGSQLADGCVMVDCDA